MSVRDSIMAALSDEGPVTIEVPEWNCSVSLRRFSVVEWMELLGSEAEDRPWKILAAAMMDEQGEPVLSAEDITSMPSSQSDVLLRLFMKVQEINGGDVPGEA